MAKKDDTNNEEKTYYLSEIQGSKVFFRLKRIGKLVDLKIVDKDKIAEVTHITVARRFGWTPLLVPIEKVVFYPHKRVEINIDDMEKYEGEPGENSILLKDHILDKKVLDMEDREVEIVYDAILVEREGKLYVTAVDVSSSGLFRRLGLKWLANLLNKMSRRPRERTIAWTYLQPLPDNIGSFKGNVKLTVLKDSLAEIPAVDLAKIFDELNPKQREILFNELDTDQASDTLEEISPNIQRSLISSLKKERVVKLINIMTSGQAADILAALPHDDAQEILTFIDKENAEKIKQIMDKHEEKISHYTTKKFIKFKPEVKVKDALEKYPHVARNKDVVMYLYILTNDGTLLGVIDIKELLHAGFKAKLGDIMVTTYVSLHMNDNLKYASEMFSKYEFRALPVVDDNKKLLGVVTYRDVMNLKHLFIS